MRIRMFCVAVFVCLLYTASSYSSVLNNLSVFDVSSLSRFSDSKPTSSSYIKLASVQFLGIQNERSLKYTCTDGWLSDDSGGCKLNECEGYPYDLNSPQLKMCGTGSGGTPDVEMCLRGNGQKFRCKTCSSPLVSDGSGGCKCDTEVYHVNSEEGCPKVDGFSGGEFDEGGVTCVEVTAEDKEITYYKGCKCPEGWTACSQTKNHVGVDPGCKTSEGQIMYSSCRCEDRFSETCSRSGEEPAGEKCTDSRGTRYTACVSCDITKGTVANKDEYWCNSDHTGHIEWDDIGFESMTSAYKSWSN